MPNQCATGHSWTTNVRVCHGARGHELNKLCTRCYERETHDAFLVGCPECKHPPPPGAYLATLGSEMVDHDWETRPVAGAPHVAAKGHAAETRCRRCAVAGAPAHIRGPRTCAACHLASPELESPAAGAALAPGTVVVRWRPVEAARAYLVTIADRHTGEKLVEQRVEKPELTPPPGALVDGHAYRVSVRAESDMPFEGPAAERDFEVRSSSLCRVSPAEDGQRSYTVTDASEVRAALRLRFGFAEPYVAFRLSFPSALEGVSVRLSLPSSGVGLDLMPAPVNNEHTFPGRRVTSTALPAGEHTVLVCQIQTIAGEAIDEEYALVAVAKNTTEWTFLQDDNDPSAPTARVSCLPTGAVPVPA